LFIPTVSTSASAFDEISAGTAYRPRVITP
jgi:hypothetical protein